MSEEIEFKLGQIIEVGNINYYVKGVIVKIIEPHQLLAQCEMELYAGFTKHINTPEYRSVKGETCTRRRLVLERIGESKKNYTIVPVNYNKLQFRMVE